NAIAELLSKHIDAMTYEEILELVEHPKNTSMGDFAFPCFKLSKAFRKAPNVIAESLKVDIVVPEFIDQIEAVSGFLNFKVNSAHFAKSVIGEVISKKDKYGSSDVGEGKKTIIEYSSVNIA